MYKISMVFTETNSSITLGIDARTLKFKGIVSRDLHICFLIPFNRPEIPAHKEWVLLLLKFRFLVELFYFRFSA
jgi:hypothetical protein